MAYAEIKNFIKEQQFHISSDFIKYIKLNENIDVRGISYDNDGIEYGFDYYESYIHNISSFEFMIYSIDEISEKNQKLPFRVKQIYLPIVFMTIIQMLLGILKIKNIVLLIQ